MERHRPSEPIAAWIEAVVHGQDMQRANLSGPAVLLPVWVWGIPVDSVGRKGGPVGHRVLLPLRIRYTNGSSVAGLGQRVGWEVDALGVHSCGTAVAGDQLELGEFGTLTATPVFGPDAADAVVEAGRIAWWNLLTECEQIVRPYVRRAHSAARTELSQFWRRDVPPLITSADEDLIVNRIVLGDSGSPSPATRLLQRCLGPATFRRVDPVKCITRALRRDVDDELHRTIGDPDDGRKIRAVAAEHDLSDPKGVLEAYRRSYPGESMGLKRVQAALSVGFSGAASLRSVNGVYEV